MVLCLPTYFIALFFKLNFAEPWVSTNACQGFCNTLMKTVAFCVFIFTDIFNNALFIRMQEFFP